MANSSFTLQNLVDDARAMGELAPTLPTGGSFEITALSAANDVITALVAGGNSRGNRFNWKFNRLVLPTFYLNSWQQDYAVPGVVNLGWLESCGAFMASSSQQPKPYRVMEVKRDVLITVAQTGNVAKIEWMNNDTLQYGVWGQSTTLALGGQTNPGPSVVYTTPVGALSMPANPITQVKDAFGNLWVVTTYGTCGASNPFISNLNPVFPDLNNPTTVATTVADGSVVWTAVNPKGQGFRINPMPPQTGPVWQIYPIGQQKVAKFTKLSQFIEPIPDDFFSYFKQGFFAQLYRRSPDPKVRAKFQEEWKLWMKSLDDAVRQGSREDDDWGFVPTTQVMDTGYAWNPISPSLPFGPWVSY